MSASLVGSEMCIRDSPMPNTKQHYAASCGFLRPGGLPPTQLPALVTPVSYTHLTLPTICSV
eukprot:13095930-Alexandrium_andersonii.AAC.1